MRRLGPLQALAMLLVVHLLAPQVGGAGAQVGQAPGGRGKFHERRDQQLRGSAPKPSERGHLMSVDPAGGRAALSVDAASLLDRFEDQDLVIVRVGPRSVLARVVTPETYEAIVGDSGTLDSLDVDVLLVADGASGVFLVALAGALPDWLAASTGAAVRIRRR